ncbi:MAG: vitamin K epoxide reductase family protein [Terracidiphilus sp.]
MRPILIILALAGIVVSALALKVHYDTGTEPCSINDHWDCGIVNHSSFAMIHGVPVVHEVPVAVIGIAGYLLIGVLALARRRVLVFIAALIGMGFALHLTYIEDKILEVWCLYCVISQGIIALITLLSAGWLIAAQIAKLRANKQASA